MISLKIFTGVAKFLRIVFEFTFELLSARKNCEDSCPEKSLFHSDTPVTIEWLNHAQSLRTWSLVPRFTVLI